MAKRTNETAAKTTKKTRITVPPAVKPTHQAIAVRAYELFLARGGEHGTHEEDWLRAEKELSDAS